MTSTTNNMPTLIPGRGKDKGQQAKEALDVLLRKVTQKPQQNDLKTLNVGKEIQQQPKTSNPLPPPLAKE